MFVWVLQFAVYSRQHFASLEESPQNNKNSPSFHKFIATRFSRQQPLDGVYMKYPTPCSNEGAHMPIPGWRGSVVKVCTVLLLDLCAVLVAST